MNDSKVIRRDIEVNWKSLISVIIIQAQNAFNDNFVKFLLIGLVINVSIDNYISKNVEYIMSLMIPLPIIFFAPIAGWFSDKFSKRDVIAKCLYFQITIFVMIFFAIFYKNLEMCILGYFLLSVQTTFFSPAKYGILKEIVGSNKLTMANGLIQMMSMFGILFGMYLGGEWFSFEVNKIKSLDTNFNDTKSSWKAVEKIIIIISLISLIPLMLIRKVKITPNHDNMKFSLAIIKNHFLDIRYIFNISFLRIISLLISSYWILVNFLGIAFFGFVRKMNTDANKVDLSSDYAKLILISGVGFIIGSIIISVMSKNRNIVSLSSIGIFGMAILMVFLTIFNLNSIEWKFSLSMVGFFSSFIVIPLNALFQNLIEERHRGRVLASQNLLNSLFSSIMIIILLIFNNVNLSLNIQVWMVSSLALLIGFFMIFYFSKNKNKISC